MSPSLHLACRFGSAEAARLLLEPDAEIEKPSSSGQTPLHLEVVRLLLETNAEMKKAYKGATSPMLLASFRGHVEVARLLWEANGDHFRDGATQMRMASHEGHVGVVWLLLEATAEKDHATDDDGKALMAIARRDAVVRWFACC